MVKNKNYLFLRLKKYTEVTLLSFLLSYLVLSGISMNVYLGTYATVILILYFAAGNGKNTEIVQEILMLGVCATVGFFISRLTMGHTLQNIWNNWSYIRFLLLGLCVLEYIIFLLFLIKQYKKLQKEEDQINKKSQPLELFTTRESDLERLSHVM